jgi:hypothetical protein
LDVSGRDVFESSGEIATQPYRILGEPSRGWMNPTPEQ